MGDRVFGDRVFGDGVFGDVDAAVRAAAEAQQRVAEMTLAERGRIVTIIRRLCRERATELAERELAETRIGRVDHKVAKLEAIESVLGVEAMRSDAFAAAFRSEAFAEAMRSEAFANAMRNDAFREALRAEALSQAFRQSER